MKQMLRISEMMPYLPSALKDAIHHVAKDTGNATDALELHRHTHSEKAKVNELDPSSRKSLAYVSYRTQDRDDEIVIPKSLKLDEFRKYSSVLVNHNYSLLPVGSDEWIDADDFGIKALTVHADTGAGTMANVVWDLVRQGHLKGRSVGFVPTSYTKPGARDWDHVANQLQSNWKEFDKGRAEKSVSRIITGGVLLEHSFVSVPCNTDAELIGVVKSMNLDGKIIKQLGLEEKQEKVPSVCDECGYVADAVPGSKCPECKTGDMKAKGREKAIEIRVVSKGGPGSGNFGHSGRPGERGGSGEGGGSGNGNGGEKEDDALLSKLPANIRAEARRALANYRRSGEHWGVFHDSSGRIRAERINPTAQYEYSFRTDKEKEELSKPHGSKKSFHSHAVEKPNPHMPGGSFSACVLIMEDKGHDSESAKKICGALQAESGEKALDGLTDVEVKAVAGALIEMKGDLPGHEFHGNQYTAGGGGGGSGTRGEGGKGSEREVSKVVERLLSHESDPSVIFNDAADSAEARGKLETLVEECNTWLENAKGTDVYERRSGDIKTRLRSANRFLKKTEWEKSASVPCTCDECGAEADCAPGSACQEEGCEGTMQPTKEKKTFVPDVKVIRPAPSIKVLYVPPDADAIAKGVSDAVMTTLARRTGKIL